MSKNRIIKLKIAYIPLLDNEFINEYNKKDAGTYID